MAYLRDLPRPMCSHCQYARATKELFDRWNNPIRKLCARCATNALRSMEESEKARPDGIPF